MSGGEVGQGSRPESGRIGIVHGQSWSSYLETGIESPELVTAVWFSPDAKLTESDIKNLNSFPNLDAIHLPCEHNAEWLAHFKKSKTLKLLSLSGSNATDECIDVLIPFEKLRILETENTQVSNLAIERFVSSTTPNRSANQAFVQ